MGPSRPITKKNIVSHTELITMINSYVVHELIIVKSYLCGMTVEDLYLNVTIFQKQGVICGMWYKVDTDSVEG